MLREIFKRIAAEAESYLLLKGLSTKVNLGDPVPSEGNHVYIFMQDYGIDPILRNRKPPVLDDDLSQTPNFSHLISFSILPVSSDYEIRLQLIEYIVELFEVKPFFQFEIGKEEYELSISMKTASAVDYQQFWIARRQPPQPIVFYQARVSSL